MKNLKDLSVDDVMEVYSGHPGCACGCRPYWSSRSSGRGNYRVHPNHAALADKRRGYKSSTINLAQVKKVLFILQEQDEQAQLQQRPSPVEDFGTGYSVEVGNRIYAVYPVVL